MQHQPANCHKHLQRHGDAIVATETPQPGCTALRSRACIHRVHRMIHCTGCLKVKSAVASSTTTRQPGKTVGAAERDSKYTTNCYRKSATLHTYHSQIPTLQRPHEKIIHVTTFTPCSSYQVTSDLTSNPTLVWLHICTTLPAYQIHLLHI